jgi:hypothetical protein
MKLITEEGYRARLTLREMSALEAARVLTAHTGSAAWRQRIVASARPTPTTDLTTVQPDLAVEHAGFERGSERSSLDRTTGQNAGMGCAG